MTASPGGRVIKEPQVTSSGVICGHCGLTLGQADRKLGYSPFWCQSNHKPLLHGDSLPSPTIQPRPFSFLFYFSLTWEACPVFPRHLNHVSNKPFCTLLVCVCVYVLCVCGSISTNIRTKPALGENPSTSADDIVAFHSKHLGTKSFNTTYWYGKHQDRFRGKS